jgi:hypothetical protein
MLHRAWVSEDASDTEQRSLALVVNVCEHGSLSDGEDVQQVDRTLRFQIDQSIEDCINLDHSRIGFCWDGARSGGLPPNRAPLDQESEGTARCWIESVPSHRLLSSVAGPRSITDRIVL